MTADRLTSQSSRDSHTSVDVEPSASLTQSIGTDVRPAAARRSASENRFWRRIKIFALCTVVVVIWIVLLLPVILYEIPSSNNGSRCSMGGNLAKENGSGEAPSPQLTTCNNITCHEGFYCNEHDPSAGCRPMCGLWSQYKSTTNLAVNSVILLAECIGIISGVAIIIIAGFRWRKVLVFPSSLAVYQAVTLLILSFVILMSYMDNTTLYCSSQDLTQGLTESTPFCIFAGAISLYCLCQLALFWFLHILALFWKTRFPFHARSFQKSHRMKYVHIACIGIGILLPIVPVVAIMAHSARGKSLDEAVKGGLGFGITRFPPLLCTGVDGDTVFYSITLPIIVIVMIGITLLAALFWMFHKHRGLFKASVTESLAKSKIETAERKLLFVFVYYVFVIVFILLGFSLRVKGRETFLREVMCYFECESRGVDPDNPCDKSGYESDIQLVMTAIAYVLLGVFPLANFIFIVNIRQSKKHMERWLLLLLRRPSDQVNKDKNNDKPKVYRESRSSTQTSSTSTVTAVNILSI